MSNILNKICKDKMQIVEMQRKKVSEKELQLLIEDNEKPRGFKKAIDEKFNKKELSIIAEIKKGSPSKGIISQNFNPVDIAKKYTYGNATCISVLTDKKYFFGSDNDLISVKKNSTAPILRKDFIVSEYQILESRALGADCILLIHSVLNYNTMQRYIKIAYDLNMDVLVETHSIEELKYWVNNDQILLGINNRNLKNMHVNLNNSVNVKKSIKTDKNIVCESGIITEKDIDYLLQNNFKTFLIGEFLMRNKSPEILLYNLLNKVIQ